MPYISASIIIQLLAAFPGRLEQLKKEGEQGRQQLNQYTRYLTVVLAVVQSYGIAIGLQGGEGIVTNPGLVFVASTVITLTGGTMFLMWLGEQITARGIGNGVSLIIFAGIVAAMPGTLAAALRMVQTGGLAAWVLFALLAMFIAAIVLIVFIERSQRRVLVQYPKRQVGNQVMQGNTSFLPLKINISGVIPPIFASSLLLLPATIASFAGQTEVDESAPRWQQISQTILQDTSAALQHGQPLFMTLNTEETADNLRKNGGFLPGVRPGARTAEYLDKLMTRLTVIGAAYLTFVCVVPELLISSLDVSFFLSVLGGTALLIVVSVTIDTVAQVQSHMLAHQYEGLLKKSKLKGRDRR
jgi:preprotein translocase subunit SecY